MRLFFNDDINDDMLAVLAILEGMGFNEKERMMDVDISKIAAILKGIRQDFPHKDGLEKASVFKKVATFLVYFVSEKPILSEIPGAENLPQGILEIKNHVNTLAAILISFAALHEAMIHGQDGQEKCLTTKIRLSRHSLIDLVDALSYATPHSHFKIVAVLLEQLAYKSNPGCQYAPVHEL